MKRKKEELRKRDGAKIVWTIQAVRDYQANRKKQKKQSNDNKAWMRRKRETGQADSQQPGINKEASFKLNERGVNENGAWRRGKRENQRQGSKPRGKKRKRERTGQLRAADETWLHCTCPRLALSWLKCEAGSGEINLANPHHSRKCLKGKKKLGWNPLDRTVTL